MAQPNFPFSAGVVRTFVAGMFALCLPSYSATAQTRPISEGFVQRLGRVDSNSDPNVNAANVIDDNLGTSWTSGSGSGPHSLNWYSPSPFRPSKIQTFPTVTPTSASVQIFFYREDGTQIGSPVSPPSGSTSTNFTLDTNQLPTENVSRIELRYSGAPVTLAELKVQSFRPGAVNPLGFPPDVPALPDKEIVAIGDGAGLFALDGSNQVRARTLDSQDSPSLVRSARVFGTAAEQLVCLRNNRIDVLDLATSAGGTVLRGTYTIPGYTSGTINMFVGDLDNAVTNGLKHPEIAIAYAFNTGSERRIRVIVLNFSNSASWVQGQPAAPRVLADVVLNRTLPNSGGINLGLLPDPTNLTGQRIGLAMGRSGVNATPALILSYISANRKIVITAHTLAALSAGSSIPLNDAQSGFEDFSESDTSFAMFDIAAMNWYPNDQSSISGPDRDEIVVVTRGRGAQFSEGWRSIRLLSLFWGEGTSVLTRDTEYVNRLIESRNPLVTIDSIVLPRVYPIRETSSTGNLLDGYDIVVRAYSTLHGMVAQGYQVFPGNGEPGIVPFSTTRYIWPFPFPALNPGLGNTGDIAVGSVLRNRTPAEISARNNFQSVFVFRAEPGIPTSTVTEVPIRFSPGISIGTASTLPLVNANGSTAAVTNAQSIVLSDIDGDSGYYSASGGIYLGAGRRMAFDGYNAPTVLFQEPPKHVDYFRSGLFDGRANRRIANFSKRRDFFAEYFDQSDSTIASTNQDKISSSFGQSFGGSLTVTAGLETPNVDASVSTTVKASLETQRSTASTRINQTSRSLGFSRTFQTADDDQVEFPNRDFDLWQYPVMGASSDVNFDRTFYQLSVPGETRPSLATTGRAAENYHPRHISGNVLSYPRYDTPAAARNDATPEAGNVYNANRSQTFASQLFADTEYAAVSTSTSSITINNTITNSSQIQQDQSISTSLDVNVTAKVTAKGGPIPGVNFSAGVESSFDYGMKSNVSFSNMQLTSLTSAVARGARFTRPGVLNDPLLGSVNYNYYPIFFFDDAGAAKLKHYVNLPTNVSVWTQYYGSADVGLNLPYRIECDQTGNGSNCNLSTGPDRWQMKGFRVLDMLDTPLPRLSDTSQTPGSIRSGDVVRLQARVYNLSASQPTDATSSVRGGTLDVRFEAEEINVSTREAIGPKRLIGTTTLASDLHPWDATWTDPNQVMWDTSAFGPVTGSTQPRFYRVSVIADPFNRIVNMNGQAINETHELEDRDSDPLLANNVRPVDMFTLNGRTFFLEKGQNNYGWFIVRIDPGTPGTPAPPEVDVALNADSLGVAIAGGPFRTSDGAVVVRGQGVQFQVRAAATGLARGPRLVGVYNGAPLGDDSNAIGFGVLGDFSGTGTSSTIVDVRTGLPWQPAAGSYVLFARVFPLTGEPNVNNNLDTITLRVLPSASTVLYVDARAIGGLGDGSSWANAFTDLDTALTASGMDTTVRVATGVYVPQKAQSLADPRTRSFVLTNGVTIEGGYAGFGSSNPDARNVFGTPTILSGDLGGDDTPNFGSRADNAYHVVLADSLPLQVVLDGLYIRGGNAIGTGQRQNTGGGLLLIGGDTIVRNCVFTDNTAVNGAGMTQDGGLLSVSGSIVGSSTSMPAITPVNQASGAGGGMYVTNALTTRLDRCTFRGNGGASSGIEGAGIYVSSCNQLSISSTLFTGHTGASVVRTLAPIGTFTNDLIASNSGAGLNTDAGATLLNCTIASNSTGIQSHGGLLTLTNTILANTTIDLQNTGSTVVATFSRSSLPALSGTGNISAPTRFVNAGLGDFHLASNSPCIDAGSNAAVVGVPFDLAGQVRIRGSRVDMGAYESSGCVADVDDGTGTGTPDGGVTIDDLLYYLDGYTQGIVRADVDDGTGTGTPDGGVTIDDLLYFLVRYQAGC